MNQKIPNFWAAILILVAYVAVETMIALFMYELGFFREKYDPAVILLPLLTGGVVISLLMSLTGLSLRNLFHDSPNSVKNTLMLLAIPLFLFSLGSMLWLDDLALLLSSFPRINTISLSTSCICSTVAR